MDFSGTPSKFSRPLKPSPAKPSHLDDEHQPLSDLTMRVQASRSGQKMGSAAAEGERSQRKTPSKESAPSHQSDPAAFLAEFETILFEERKNNTKIRDNLTAQIGSLEVTLGHLKQDEATVDAKIAELEALKSQLEVLLAESRFNYTSAKELAFFERNVLNCQAAFEEAQVREETKQYIAEKERTEALANQRLVQLRSARGEAVMELQTQIDNLEREGVELTGQLEQSQRALERQALAEDPLNLRVDHRRKLETAKFEHLIREDKRLLQGQTEGLLRLEEKINYQAAVFPHKEAEMEAELLLLEEEKVQLTAKLRSISEFVVGQMRLVDASLSEKANAESRLRLREAELEGMEREVEKRTVDNVLDLEEQKIRAESGQQEKEAELLEADRAICELEGKLASLQNEKIEVMSKRKLLSVDLKGLLAVEIDRSIQTD